MTEHTLSLVCIAWFKNEYERFGTGCVIPVPNELARKRKDIVIKDGCSDLIILLPSKVLFIELKVGYNSQQDNQINFESLVNNLGFEYYVVKSVEQFKSIL